MFRARYYRGRYWNALYYGAAGEVVAPPATSFAARPVMLRAGRTSPPRLRAGRSEPPRLASGGPLE